MLVGLCLRAVLQLLPMCRALCVTTASQLMRSRCTPCTATASRDWSLARTLQVCQLLLPRVCSSSSPPFPVVSWQAGAAVLFLSGYLVYGEICSLCCVPSPRCPGECYWRLWYYQHLLHRDIISDWLHTIIHHIISSWILPQDLVLDASSSTQKMCLLYALLRICRECGSGRKWKAWAMWAIVLQGSWEGRMFCTSPRMACALHEVWHLYVQKWPARVAETAEKFPSCFTKIAKW